jgi:hypothetical protein
MRGWVTHQRICRAPLRKAIIEELRDQKFRRAFLGEAIGGLLAGNLDSTKRFAAKA